jgi:hypothetical protein
MEDDVLDARLQVTVIKFTQCLQDIRTELRLIHQTLGEIQDQIRDSAS